MISIPTPNITPEAQAAFKKQHTKLIEALVTRLLAEPGEFDHLGDQAESTLAAGFEFTASNLEVCMQVNDASLLIDQLRWANDRLPHDGIQMDRMTKNLRVYCDVISELLPAPYSIEIAGLIHNLISAQQEIGASK